MFGKVNIKKDTIKHATGMIAKAGHGKGDTIKNATGRMKGKFKLL